MRLLSRRVFRFLSLAAGLGLALSGLSAAEPQLSLSFGEQHKDLTAADLAKLPSLELTTQDHGKTLHYRGVAVSDVLALVDAPLGEHLRGRALALVVKVVAADGYVAAFALAEFDPNFREQPILLADQQEGAPLPKKYGPWRFVCPGDKKGARSIHQVTSIEIVSLATPSAAKP